MTHDPKNKPALVEQYKVAEDVLLLAQLGKFSSKM
jgi:hypothetical protein